MRQRADSLEGERELRGPPMRRAHLLLPVGVLALVGAPGVARGGTGSRTSELLADGHRYEVRVTAREATIRPGLLGQLLLYTVSRDGKFVHPERPDGGRLLGCVRSAGGEGEVQRCSRRENGDLFRLVVGGYGLF